jgi:hypothetical protein
MEFDSLQAHQEEEQDLLHLYLPDCYDHDDTRQQSFLEALLN